MELYESEVRLRGLRWEVVVGAGELAWLGGEVGGGGWGRAVVRTRRRRGGEARRMGGMEGGEAAGMFTEFGGLNRWMHIWPYKDLNHRDEVRGMKIEGWPSGAPGRVRQENKIMVPASFSPMH